MSMGKALNFMGQMKVILVATTYINCNWNAYYELQGGDSIDILGLAQFRAQVMFGVLRHASTPSALVLYLAQNLAQFRAQSS